MSDEEIERAIHEAEQYASQDGIRSQAIEALGKANSLLSQTERALGVVSKQISRQEKKQVKQDCSHLRKVISKTSLDKISQEQLDTLNQAMQIVEQSGANVRQLFDQMNPS